MIVLSPKPDRLYQKENYRLMSLMNIIAKILTVLANNLIALSKRDKSSLSWTYSNARKIRQSINIHYIKRVKGESHMVTSIFAEKVFDRIEHSFVSNVLR